jgi:TetR/AcrR family transcriptional repressor of nem operon
MTTPSTRDRLIFAAMELFQEQGYEATSIEQVLAKANARSGSLYYSFKGGKEDLLLAVLDAYLEGLWPVVMQPAFARTEDPIERIFAVLADYRERVRITKCRYNCPIGSLALEVSESLPRARAKIAQNFEQWRDAIRGCLDAAGDRLPSELDRAALAGLVLTVMEGAVMQAHAHKSLEPFDASVKQLELYIRSLDRGRPAASSHATSPATPSSSTKRARAR